MQRASMPASSPGVVADDDVRAEVVAGVGAARPVVDVAVVAAA